jgi:hypothetical protein
LVEDDASSGEVALGSAAATTVRGRRVDRLAGPCRACDRADAEGDPGIRFVVTYGHRPAYSSGHHAGDRRLASILDSFGDRFRKYVLNLNAHSHDYERFAAIHGVVHVTASGGGAQLQAPWRRNDPRTAFRSLHLEHLRVDVTPNALILQAVCGPATKSDETSCPLGSVIDSVTISPR